jgi:DNA-directed RNA polymerase I, II, and III subunit RPABC1
VQIKGYEVTDEEVRIELDEFKHKYVNEKGYPRYTTTTSTTGAIS